MAKSESVEPADLEIGPEQFCPASWDEILVVLPIDPESANARPPLVRALGANHQHAALMGVRHPVRMDVMGSLGDYACAFNQRAIVSIRGDVGHGVAEGMRSGAVRVYGTAGDGAGAALSGGTLAVYGHAGNRCGAGMTGGEIFIRGIAGDHVGVGALGGTIVLGGDAGHGLGDAMSGATIFVRGRVASLAAGVMETQLRQRERLRLGLLLINASIRNEAKDFRRIVAIEVYEREKRESRGEIDPSWR